MKNFTGCLVLAVLTAIASTGCNKTVHQSALATPKLPALIGNTDKFESQLSIARLQEHQGQLRDATDRYQQLGAKNPKNATIPHRLGVLESKADNHDAANAHFRRSLELDPHNAEVLADWGYSLFLQGKLGEAESALRSGLKESPNDHRLLNNLALVLGHAGKAEESLALFRQVSGEAAAWVNLGYVYVNLGEGEKAAECFGKALTIDDKLQSAANALVQIADLQQQAEQRAARQKHIAKTKSSTGADSASGNIVRASHEESGNSRSGTKASPVVVAHASGQAQSVLNKPTSSSRSAAPSE